MPLGQFHQSLAALDFDFDNMSVKVIIHPVNPEVEQIVRSTGLGDLVDVSLHIQVVSSVQKVLK